MKGFLSVQTHYCKYSINVCVLMESTRGLNSFV